MPLTATLTILVIGAPSNPGDLPMLALFIAIAAIVVYGPRALRTYSLWRWRRNRGVVDLQKEPNVTTAIAAPSIETDLLVQSVTPLCQKVWTAAQTGDLSAIRSQLSAQLAERLENRSKSLIGTSPITSLTIVSTSGDSDAIWQFQALVTTESGARQRWAFIRQRSGWLVDDIAA